MWGLPLPYERIPHWYNWFYFSYMNFLFSYMNFLFSYLKVPMLCEWFSHIWTGISHMWKVFFLYEIIPKAYIRPVFPGRNKRRNPATKGQGLHSPKPQGSLKTNIITFEIILLVNYYLSTNKKEKVSYGVILYYVIDINILVRN